MKFQWNGAELLWNDHELMWNERRVCVSWSFQITFIFHRRFKILISSMKRAWIGRFALIFLISCRFMSFQHVISAVKMGEMAMKWKWICKWNSWMKWHEMTLWNEISTSHGMIINSQLHELCPDLMQIPNICVRVHQCWRAGLADGSQERCFAGFWFLAYCPQDDICATSGGRNEV